MKVPSKLIKNEMCMWMLSFAQDIGELEHRRVDDYCVEIAILLPIKVYPKGKPGYIGFKNPRYLGKHPEATPPHGLMRAARNDPRYNELVARELNKFTPVDLGKIANNFCKRTDVERVLQCTLAVIEHHEQPARDELAYRDNLQKLVDVLAPLGPLDLIETIQQYHRLLRMARSRGCQLHAEQTAQLL